MVNQALNAGLDLVNARTNENPKNPIRLVRVGTVMRQVVAGVKYKFEVIAGPSMCLGGDVSEGKAKRWRMDQWMEQSLAYGNINSYGDAPDTMYPGGTPLLDESTGLLLDVHDYLAIQHPTRPWDSVCLVAPEDQRIYSMEVLDVPWRQPHYVLLNTDIPQDAVPTSSAVPPEFESKPSNSEKLDKDLAADKSAAGSNGSLSILAALAGVLVLVGAAFMFYQSRQGSAHSQVALEDTTEAEDVDLIKGAPLDSNFQKELM